MTAVDISRVAVDRARDRAERAGITVDWQVADIAATSGSFDLVSAFYPVLGRDGDELAHVLSLVAPGGTLLFVHHVDVDRSHHQGHGFDPDRYVTPADVRQALGEGWRIERQQSVDRRVTEGAGSDHHRDGLVRAVRR